MSEQNERTSEATEVETNEDDHSDEQSKSEASMLNNQTQQALLEDEEMPTYISVSSPSRREDSDASNVKQQERIPMEDDHSRSPYPSDDQGGGSVYVLSSGEDSDHPPYNDEEEDDYEDSEDMDEMDLENEHENAMLDEEEEEDEEDEEEGIPLRLKNDNDDDIDGEFEPECFDRASDDFVLNNRLERHYKERSLSLQDLSICKNSVHTPQNKKRFSLNLFRQNYLGLSQNPVVYPVTHRKQSMPLRYRHVESKVKRYIKDIKEQSRRSMERRVKDQECVSNKNHMETENNDTEEIKQIVTNKTIKDYAEKAIKDLEREENSEDETVINGETNKTEATLGETQYKHIRRDEVVNIYCDMKQNEKTAQLGDERLEKRNGSVENNIHIQYQGSLDRNIKFNDLNQVSLVNGHQPTLFNFRTLSYEEYLHGPSNSQKEDINRQSSTIPEENNEDETYNDAEIINVPEIDNSNTSCPLKIENVKSIRMIPDEPENLNFVKVNQTDKRDSENVEITQLKSQLSQKTAQFNTLRDAYQTTLAENLKMKQELDALKKSLAKYESENKPCETKVAAVQTVVVVEPVLNKEEITNPQETNNKVSTSSVGSTIGSIDPWADSACSPAISIKPPNLSTVLNSDDSMVLTDGTPRKTGRPLSQTFITSSRILQTLSKITQGKAAPESPLVRNSKKRTNENSMDQLLNTDYNSPIQASSSKKRKATDMLGSFIQPFKIPHSSIESEKKSHNVSTDAQYLDDNQDSESQEEQRPTVANTSNLNNSMYTENEDGKPDEHDDSVKCFVYQEDENSGNKSFLIQAEEPMKDRLSIEKGRVRECGPYLLGNLEVRMSEINGTISVWGKEISQEDITDNEDEMETSMNVVEKKSCPCWQKTPHTRFNGSPIVCSTNKKSKVPLKFSGSSISQCSHSSSVNAMKMPFTLDDIGDKKLANNLFSPNVSVPHCENCDSTKHRKERSTYSRMSNSQEKMHSCCPNHIEFTDREYNCNLSHERQKRDDTPNCSKDRCNSRGVRGNSCINTPETEKHLHESLNNTADISGTSCKHNTSRRSFTHNPVENCQQHSKCLNSVRNHSYMCKSSSSSTSNQENSDRYTCNHINSNDGDEDPLLFMKRSNETPETRQRRLRGKRVRGILMDLLRGCGDCRNTSGAGNSKGVPQEKEIPYLANGPPQIKLTPCTPDPSCSSHTQWCERCCHAYERRVELRIDELRTEMERVRSRSDAILDMLSMLYSTDRN